VAMYRSNASGETWTGVTLGAVLATKLASEVNGFCIWVNSGVSVMGPPVNVALYVRMARRRATAHVGR
jgi:hypothetical protein